MWRRPWALRHIRARAFRRPTGAWCWTWSAAGGGCPMRARCWQQGPRRKRGNYGGLVPQVGPYAALWWFSARVLAWKIPLKPLSIIYLRYGPGIAPFRNESYGYETHTTSGPPSIAHRAT